MSEAAGLGPLGVPVYGENLFAGPALRHPFDHYRAIRDLAPVVRLREPDVLVLGRFADVKAALRAADVLISGKGIGFNAFVNAPRDNPSTINSDGERHRRLRKGLNRFLLPMPLQELQTAFRSSIDARVRALRATGERFDAMESLARHLPLEVVSHAVGLPEDARSEMLRWASATFNSLGLPGTGARQRQFEADIAVRHEVQDFLRAVKPTDLRAGSWGQKLFMAVEEGRMDPDEARAALAAFVLPSLDTTIYAQGNLLYALARHPGEWAKLRGNRALMTAAVMESLRYLPVVRWFSRVADADYVAGDVRIPAGSRVMLLYGAANRDERHYREPDRFDIQRAPMDQLGWGAGPHMCAGMHLARMEMEILLEVLIDVVDRIEVDEPTVVENQGLFGFASLPTLLH